MKTFTLPFILFVSLILMSCNKDTNCIDNSLKDPDGICTMDYNPVCGCDAKTYSNPCQAKNAGVTSYTAGECN